MLIMGATGFIGRNMANYFCRQSEWDVMGVYHVTSPPDGDTLAQWVYADLRDPKHVSALLNTIKPDAILQFAATTTGSKDVCLNPSVHVTGGLREIWRLLTISRSPPVTSLEWLISPCSKHMDSIPR